MVKPVATVHVVPNLPAPLTRLRELAYNLRWSWDHDSIGLFRRMDRDLWETTGHNPVWMLGLIDQRRLEVLCEDRFCRTSAAKHHDVREFGAIRFDSPSDFLPVTVDLRGRPAQLAAGGGPGHAAARAQREELRGIN